MHSPRVRPDDVEVQDQSPAVPADGLLVAVTPDPQPGPSVPALTAKEGLRQQDLNDLMSVRSMHDAGMASSEEVAQREKAAVTASRTTFGLVRDEWAKALVQERVESVLGDGSKPHGVRIGAAGADPVEFAKLAKVALANADLVSYPGPDGEVITKPGSEVTMEEVMEAVRAGHHVRVVMGRKEMANLAVSAVVAGHPVWLDRDRDPLLFEPIRKKASQNLLTGLEADDDTPEAIFPYTELVRLGRIEQAEDYILLRQARRLLGPGIFDFERDTLTAGGLSIESLVDDDFAQAVQAASASAPVPEAATVAGVDLSDPAAAATVLMSFAPEADPRDTADRIVFTAVTLAKEDPVAPEALPEPRLDMGADLLLPEFQGQKAQVFFNRRASLLHGMRDANFGLVDTDQAGKEMRVFDRVISSLPKESLERMVAEEPQSAHAFGNYLGTVVATSGVGASRIQAVREMASGVVSLIEQGGPVADPGVREHFLALENVAHESLLVHQRSLSALHDDLVKIVQEIAHGKPSERSLGILAQLSEGVVQANTRNAAVDQSQPVSLRRERDGGLALSPLWMDPGSFPLGALRSAEHPDLFHTLRSAVEAAIGQNHDAWLTKRLQQLAQDLS